MGTENVSHSGADCLASITFKVIFFTWKLVLTLVCEHFGTKSQELKCSTVSRKLGGTWRVEGHFEPFLSLQFKRIVGVLWGKIGLLESWCGFGVDVVHHVF